MPPSRFLVAGCVCALALTVALSPACRTPPQRSANARDPFEWVRVRTAWQIENAMADADATAVAVVLVDASGRDGGIIWAEGFGRGPLAGQVDADSVFRVGSLSKLVTSVVTMTAASEGVVDVDAPITAALPHFSIHSRFTDARAPTLRDLMTHHSGLPSELLRGMYGTGRGDYTTVIDVLRDEHLSTPPGLMFTYSNAGYALLGHAVEVAGHERFDQRASRTLFAPLGMVHTSFDPDSVVAAQVLPAWMNGETFAQHTPTTTPANGLFTSATDLGRLMAALMRHGVAENGTVVVAPDDVDEVLCIDNADVALDAGFHTGLGINLLPPIAPGSGPLAQHSGQAIAFVAELMMLPEHQLGVAVLTNTPDHVLLPQTIARDALALLLEAKTGVAPVPPAPVIIADDVDDAVLLRGVGTFATDYGLITLDVAGHTLRGTAFDETIELRPTTDGAFDPWILGYGLIPVQPDILRHLQLGFTDIDGRRAMVSTRFGEHALRGVRIEPTPIHAAWTARLGRYENTDPGDDQITITGAELAMDHGFLVIRLSLSRYPRPLTMALVTLGDDEAITAGLGRSMGETVRVDDEGRLLVVGYPLQRVGP